MFTFFAFLAQTVVRAKRGAVVDDRGQRFPSAGLHCMLFFGHSSIQIFSRAVMNRAKDKLEGRDKKLLEDYCRGVDSVHDYSSWKICLSPEQSGLTGRLL